MEFLADWARQIAAYLIVGSVLGNLIRKQNYQKYVRLIMGIILIVLLASPIIKLCGLSENYQFYLSRYLLTEEAKDSSFLSEINEWKEEKMVGEVEIIVKERIVRIVKSYGLEVKELNVKICTQEAEFGTLEEVELVLLTEEDVGIVFGTDSPDAIRIRDRIAEEFGAEKSGICITIY